jgi:chromosome segregation ATPase
MAEALKTNKAAQNAVARILRRAKRTVMGPRNRDGMTPAAFEQARQERKRERQTAAAALAAASTAADNAAKEAAGLRATLAATQERHVAELAKATKAAADAMERATNASEHAKAMEAKEAAARKLVAVTDENVKVLQDKLAAAANDRAKLAAVLRDADVAAKTLVEANQRLQAENA